MADVSKALQSVWALVKARHVVVFGAGDAGDERYVCNKISRETNALANAGINYLMGMYVVPRNTAGFGRPAP